MASIINDADGFKRLQFTSPRGGRRTIYLGQLSDKAAETIKGHVEQIITAVKSNTLPHRTTAEWLVRIPDELAGKLAATGLIVPRQSAEGVGLGDYVKAYRAHRADVGKGTNTNYGIIGNRLLAFFKADRQLHTITEGDADRWLVWLKTEYAGPTVSKSIKIARQFWTQAIRDGLATINPFQHLRTPSEVNTARAFFIDRATFAQVLTACPDHEWRLLLALARYGGLRTPSEPLALEWADVNWERQRLRLVAPKTKHEDGGERWVPLFPELLPILEEAFDRAEPGAVHVVTRWRDSEQNLRTGLLRILRRAGVKAWPRLYQNLRASRETELCERFPIHVVAEWLGNSPKTALAHYTQTTEEHFRQAVDDDSKTAQKTAHFDAIGTGKEGTAPGSEMTDCPSVPQVAACGHSRPIYLMTPTGSEHMQETQGKQQLSGAAAQKTAHFVPDSAASGFDGLVASWWTLPAAAQADLWPVLPPAVQARIIAAAQSKGERQPDLSS